MTVIAAIARNGHVVVAGDRESGYVGSPIYGARKIRRFSFKDNGEFLLAAAGNGAMLPVIARGLAVDLAPASNELAEDDWANEVAVAVTEILDSISPPLVVKPEDATVIDGALLLGFSGRLWYVFTHQALLVDDGIAALGSGADLAIGSMHRDLAHGLAPERAVLEAVDLGCRFAPGCGVSPESPVQLEALNPPN